MIDAKHAVRDSGLPGEERPDRFGDDPTDSALREPQVHIQNTRHQYNLPAFEKPIHRAANREGIADRFDDPMVAASIQIDSNLLDSLHQQILFVERQIAEQARSHDPVAVQLLRTIPGVGKTLAFTILYEVGDIERFPSVGRFISYSR